jgi:hypothetical protein
MSLNFVADQGVKHVFFVTGGGAMHLNASLATEKKVSIYAPMMAMGFKLSSTQFLRRTGYYRTKWPLFQTLVRFLDITKWHTLIQL